MDFTNQFITTYNRLSQKNLYLLDNIYADNLSFSDPAHHIQGLPAFKRYLSALYQNINLCHFDFVHANQLGPETYLHWNMTLQHPKLNQGDAFTMPGISYLKINEDNLVYHHEDFFDLGDMLYERLPVVGKVIRKIKQRLGQ